MRKIICVSTSNYHPFPTRKQNVMNRLGEAEILYFDPAVSVIAPLKDRSALHRLFAFRKDGVKVRDNITVYAVPPVLPFFNKYRWINRINQFLLARYIRRRMREQGFADPYLWCYSPTSCDLVGRIPSQGVIYDCVDRHSAYKGMINPAVVDRMEEELARVASQVFCTAQGLYDTLSSYNKNTRLIPNGAAYEIFSKAQDDVSQQDEPEARSEVSMSKTEPVFGFVGMLQDCIDYECIEAVAKAFPEGKVVLIGKTLPGVDVSALELLPNVVFKGLIPQEQLPHHIREFDVCLNVFRKGRLSKDVSPLKFYEYLATGKPVVSTEEPLQVLDYADVVYIANDPSEFVVKCREALYEKGTEKRAKRIQYGKASSWDQRVKEMEKTLIENGIFEI